MTHWRFLALSLAALPVCAGATWFEEVGVQPGPHPVGFRIVAQRDYSRLQSKGDDRSTSIPICIWYPAARDAAKPAMRLSTYWSLGRNNLTVPPPPDENRAASRTEIPNLSKNAFSQELDDARLDRVLNLEMLGRRDVPAAPGRFPVVVGGIESPRNGAAIGEFLASRGYIVLTTPSTALTGTQQASRPLLALETQTRNLEFLAAFAQTLPEADLSRLAIVGVNFDGMAALNFGMRNLGASAIVSLDGYEGKVGTFANLRSALYFNTARLHAPYLLFLQHEKSPGPNLVLTDAIFDSLRYASREAYVIEGLAHGHYVVSLLAGAVSSAAGKRDLAFVLNRVGDWLDAHVKKDAPAIARLRSVPEGPVFLKKRQEPALEPLPTEEEVETMVMSGGIVQLTELYRRAVRANPGAIVFEPGTLDILAFRFDQRGDFNTAIAIELLRTEAYPGSWNGWGRLAEHYVKAGKTAEAIAAAHRAITALDGDASIDTVRKNGTRTMIQERIQELRAPK